MKTILGSYFWSCLWLSLIFSTTAWSQNLVVNGDFNQNIDNWDNSNTQITWVSDDGSAATGALEISDNFNNGGSATAAQLNHIEVQQGVIYELSAAVKVMPYTEAQGALIFLQWLDADERYVGFTDYLYSDSNTANGTWHNISERFTPPENMYYARLLVAVTGSSSGSTDFAIARWDDVRFTVADATEFQIVAAHSGSWYNPNQSGHGLNVEILDDNRLLVYWYTYDLQGNPIWLFASGSHDGNEALIDVYIAGGAMFPPDFNPNDVNVALWGQFYLKFTGCNTGEFKWIPVIGSVFTAGEMIINRLTQLKGHSCAE